LAVDAATVFAEALVSLSVMMVVVVIGKCEVFLEEIGR
jgi:hypothetical protein